MNDWRTNVLTRQRAAVFCDPAGKRSPWGWLRHCPVTKNEQEGFDSSERRMRTG